MKRKKKDGKLQTLIKAQKHKQLCIVISQSTPPPHPTQKKRKEK